MEMKETCERWNALFDFSQVSILQIATTISSVFLLMFFDPFLQNLVFNLN
jgi:low affinity Fe/Cu permease